MLFILFFLWPIPARANHSIIEKHHGNLSLHGFISGDAPYTQGIPTAIGPASFSGYCLRIYNYQAANTSGKYVSVPNQDTCTSEVDIKKGPGAANQPWLSGDNADATIFGQWVDYVDDYPDDPDIFGYTQCEYYTQQNKTSQVQVGKNELGAPIYETKNNPVWGFITDTNSNFGWACVMFQKEKCPKVPPPNPHAFHITIVHDENSEKAAKALACNLRELEPFKELQSNLDIGQVAGSAAAMACQGDANLGDLITCNDDYIAGLAGGHAIIAMTSQVPNGRGSAHGIVAHVAATESKSAALDARHELGHALVGLGDEYTISASDTTELQVYCTTPIQYPNIQFFTPLSSYGSDDQARQIHKNVPWVQFISSATHVLTGNQLGTPAGYPLPAVGLYRNNRCGTNKPGWVAHTDSFMNNFNGPLPPYHWYLYARAINSEVGANIVPQSPPNEGGIVCPSPSPTTSSSPKPTPTSTVSPSPTPSC